MEIKDIIRQKREEMNLTYEQLGNMLGVGKSTVRKWETGMIENMRRDNIVALAKVLNISPAVIMGWNNIEKSVVPELTQSETVLLSAYNKLNDLGKQEAEKRVAELTCIDKYISKNIMTIDEAQTYLKNFQMAAYGGEDFNTLTDEQIIDRAIALKHEFEEVPHKYKK